MKEQRMVVEYTAQTFKAEVNNYMRCGWRIVPNTIAITIYSFGHNNVNAERCYVCVLEEREASEAE